VRGSQKRETGKLNNQAEEIEAWIGQDFFIFKSFPEAGPALAPCLVVTFGSRRERPVAAFQSSDFSKVLSCWES